MRLKRRKISRITKDMRRSRKQMKGRKKGGDALDKRLPGSFEGGKKG
jgi:hypothetical protein